jgi:hypothetical protein
MATVPFCTREAVKTALDSQLTARDDARVDRAIKTAAETIVGDLHRGFAPITATRSFDWPNNQYAPPYRLWLDGNELVSVTSITVDGVALTVGTYTLRRSDDLDQPPYDRIELDTDSSSTFSGASSHQQAVVVVGVWNGDNTHAAAGALAEALETTTETDVNVTDVSTIGVGSLLRVGTEWMLVTAKTMLDSGQNLGANLTASEGDTLVNLTLGTAFHVGEELLIDAERMLLVDIAANNGVVKRAWNGSVLAAHTAPADIFVPRTLMVERGAQGSTAATHLTAAALTVWVPPPLIESLAIAEAITTLQQELAAYGRTVGAGENEREAAGKGLEHIRRDAMVRYGRQARVGAI